MNVSSKCQYALRAMFELAKRYWAGPVKVYEIAESQAIPARFLEQILNQLRQGGFVESRRGAHGGYLLSTSPAMITVGEIIRFIDGPIAPVQCIAGDYADNCPLYGQCAFISLWTRARDAINNVYNRTTLQDLVDEEVSISEEYIGDYCI